MDATSHTSSLIDRAGDLQHLAEALKAASGAERDLDTLIAEAFGAEPADYTASADKCRRLCSRVLPTWQLRVGYDVCGVLPAATLAGKRSRANVVAPTVPLAILRTMMDAVLDECDNCEEASVSD